MALYLGLSHLCAVQCYYVAVTNAITKGSLGEGQVNVAYPSGSHSTTEEIQGKNSSRN